MDEELLDFTKLKYVLYARKSTDDPQRQVRSIDDQILECTNLAKQLRLNVVDTLKEMKSAKSPNQRPIFSQMLKDIRAGKYDAILAWNPDRLARNMLEAGMIIDMADSGVIQDFKFVTHVYSPDANGKMLLGMSFVLSKQYSDDLSQKVTRGVRRSLAEGKALNSKHGYTRDDRGLQTPDDNNFNLICDAWQMRKEDTSLEDIANYMNKNGYGRLIKSSGKKVKMNKNILSELFHDPFYYGLLIQAGEEADLRTLYDFKPAVTEENYFAIQQLSGRKIKPFKGTSFLPLKLMVQCSLCGNNMYAGVSKGNTKKYLFYRCDNNFCSRKKKSVRSKIIFNFVYKFLEDGLSFTENEYNKYYNNLKRLSDAQRETIARQIHNMNGTLILNRSEIKQIGLGLLRNNVKDNVREIGQTKIDDLERQNEELRGDIEKLNSQITNPETDKLSFEQVLNLSKNAGKIIKSGNAATKDVLCRYIFLNFVVDDEKVLSYQLKPPFDEILKTKKSAFVGERGLEPPTSRSQTERSTN
jgi:DNA invertase Pin-like site-specific DNA recombinase